MSKCYHGNNAALCPHTHPTLGSGSCVHGVDAMFCSDPHIPPVTSADELRKAAMKIATELGVLAGAAHQAPISREEGRQEVIALLRSEDWRIASSGSGEAWADWLEKKLRGEG